MRKPKTAMKISGAFRKSVRHIPAEIKRKLTQVIETLARDPHTQELQMEKLKVPSDQVYSVRLSHKFRLIFRRLSCGTIRTSNPGTCELVTEGCALSEDGLTCFTADGYPVVIKYGFNHTLKVTSVPAHLCGLYGTATGVYQLKH